jgi:hypothetical protein
MDKFNFKKLIQSIEEMKLIRAGKLKPARVTSEKEIREWMAKNPDAIKSIKKGVKELEEGKGDVVDDLDSYLEKLKAVNTKAIKVKIKK